MELLLYVVRKENSTKIKNVKNNPLKIHCRIKQNHYQKLRKVINRKDFSAKFLIQLSYYYYFITYYYYFIEGFKQIVKMVQYDGRIMVAQVHNNILNITKFVQKN